MIQSNESSDSSLEGTAVPHGIEAHHSSPFHNGSTLTFTEYKQ